ncbi:MAG: hypothetical protein AUG48_01475 [Actinobacteria bacterium 13_1_20CM_3_68_9]|nr:MAG: hypothetical protein AUG48_01475 [Actinobacteria bacterium 13_1_20CM_3_68_9]
MRAPLSESVQRKAVGGDAGQSLERGGQRHRPGSRRKLEVHPQGALARVVPERRRVALHGGVRHSERGCNLRGQRLLATVAVVRAHGDRADTVSPMLGQQTEQ